MQQTVKTATNSWEIFWKPNWARENEVWFLEKSIWSISKSFVLPEGSGQNVVTQECICHGLASVHVYFMAPLVGFLVSKIASVHVCSGDNLHKKTETFPVILCLCIPHMTINMEAMYCTPICHHKRSCLYVTLICIPEICAPKLCWETQLVMTKQKTWNNS
jgi:hypothetical protein